MKKTGILSMILMIALASPSLFAAGGLGLKPDEILAAVPGVATKVPGELTLGEWAALAGEFSVARQKAVYIRRAEVSSFILPGAGQFMTKDYALGALHLGAQAAIIGGTAAAFWYLLPSDLQDASLSFADRRSLMRSRMTSGDIVEMLPSMGVAIGGTALSLVNSYIASAGAGKTARANIESGKALFEPQICLPGGRFGLGLRLKMH